MAEQPLQQEVTLIREHTHNGILLPSGSKITVNPAEYAFLKEKRLIAVLAQKPTPTQD